MLYPQLLALLGLPGLRVGELQTGLDQRGLGLLHDLPLLVLIVLLGLGDRLLGEGGLGLRFDRLDGSVGDVGQVDGLWRGLLIDERRLRGVEDNLCFVELRRQQLRAGPLLARA